MNEQLEEPGKAGLFELTGPVWRLEYNGNDRVDPVEQRTTERRDKGPKCGLPSRAGL